MSIVLIGMEMPKSCDDCFLPLRYCPYAMKENGECPLIPLPEGHGRLGDLDEARKRWLNGEEDVLLNAPTIVPAEGGTDNA